MTRQRAPSPEFVRYVERIAEDVLRDILRPFSEGNPGPGVLPPFSASRIGTNRIPGQYRPQPAQSPSNRPDNTRG